MNDDPLNRLKVKRGNDLPQSKLTETDVINIRSIVEYRDKLKKELRGLSNAKIAEKFEVHYRTIERVVAVETWTHV